MTNSLDIVEDIRSVLKAAYKQATTDLQKKSIYWALANLSELEGEIIVRELGERAAEIQPLGAVIRQSIESLSGVASGCVIQQLNDIALKSNLEV